MRADERAYRRRGRLWLLVVVAVAVLFWAIAPDIEHERITPVCEICGREATTALPDADGKFHAYCQEHAGQSVRTQQLDRTLGVRLDTEGFPGLIYDTVQVRGNQGSPSFYMPGGRAPTARDWLWSHPLLVDGQWVDVPGFAPPRSPESSRRPPKEEPAVPPASRARDCCCDEGISEEPFDVGLLPDDIKRVLVSLGYVETTTFQSSERQAIEALIDVLNTGERTMKHLCASMGGIVFEQPDGCTFVLEILPGHDPAYYEFRHEGVPYRVDRGAFIAALKRLGCKGIPLGREGE
jgi:hypothetical protein